MLMKHFHLPFPKKNIALGLITWAEVLTVSFLCNTCCKQCTGSSVWSRFDNYKSPLLWRWRTSWYGWLRNNPQWWSYRQCSASEKKILLVIWIWHLPGKSTQQAWYSTLLTWHLIYLLFNTSFLVVWPTMPIVVSYFLHYSTHPKVLLYALIIFVTIIIAITINKIEHYVSWYLLLLLLSLSLIT